MPIYTDRIVMDDPDAGKVVAYHISNAIEYSASAAGVALHSGNGNAFHVWSWWSLERLDKVPTRHEIATLAVEQARRLAKGEPLLEVWEEEPFLASKRSAA